MLELILVELLIESLGYLSLESVFRIRTKDIHLLQVYWVDDFSLIPKYEMLCYFLDFRVRHSVFYAKL